MPPTKQPVPLKDMTMNFLVNRLSNYCDEASTEDSLEKLRERVTIIKEEICPHIPWHLSGEFHDGFLQKFFKPLDLHRPVQRPGSHKRAALEIIMDREIFGLRIRYATLILDVLDEDDLQRIEGLAELRWDNLSDHVVRPGFENLHLSALKKMIFEENCTDAHLRVIGQNCPRLIYLDASGSGGITDEGLRALNKCPELQVVRVSKCPRVSRNGVLELLSGHEKIRRIYAWDNPEAEGFDCFSQSDSSVYPSIETFNTAKRLISDQELLTVVEKFPNLTSLTIPENVTGDLCALSSLKKLAKLDLRFNVDSTYDNLKQLLVVIGANITELRTCYTGGSTSHMTQDGLNFLFEHCGNMECLDFEYSPRLDGEVLVIPPFEKLKQLGLSIHFEHRHLIGKLRFGKMSKLEMLMINKFHMPHELVESMVVDNVMFPNLVSILTVDTSGTYDIKRIREIAKNKNLNFDIWHTE